MTLASRFLVLTVVGLVGLVSPALADGPFEPNETAVQAAGPQMGETVTAALETPQDVDWYRFYAKPQSQVGVLATLAGPCGVTSGSITVSVYDADGAYWGPSVNLTLGYTPLASSSPTTADRGTFTSEAGHRYFIKVRQSLCQGVGYAIQVAPAEDLMSSMQDTLGCSKARLAASLARRRLFGLRAAAKRSHGARRRSLGSRMALQRQLVVVAEASAKSGCARRPLDGAPFT